MSGNLAEWIDRVPVLVPSTLAMINSVAEMQLLSLHMQFLLVLSTGLLAEGLTVWKGKEFWDWNQVNRYYKNNEGTPSFCKVTVWY